MKTLLRLPFGSSVVDNRKALNFRVSTSLDTNGALS
jgi:hypothetical protein